MPISHPNLLAQMEAFYWIVRLGGFHAAARHMNLTQPTISARIRELETTLGEQFFHRGAARVALTPAGDRAFAYSEQMLNLASALRYRDDPYGGLHGVFHIGAVESVAFSFLPQLMAQVQESMPDLEHSVTLDVSRNLAGMLSRQTLDVAILSDPLSDPMLETVLLGQTDVQWVCRTDLLTPKGRLTAEDLRDIPIFSHLRESRLYEVTREWFWAQKRTPRIMVCNSLMLMSHFVKEGYGAALLPTNMVQEGVKSGALTSFVADPPIPSIPMFLSFNRNRDGPALQSFMKFLDTEVRKSELFLTGPARSAAL